MEKQTAEEILNSQYLKSHNFDEDESINNHWNTFSLTIAHLAMQEYANQQTQELQRQVESLKSDLDLSKELSNDQLRKWVKRNGELQSEVLKLRIEYTQLKEAADEMAGNLEDAINITIDSSNYDRYQKIINNYKHLTNKP